MVDLFAGVVLLSLSVVLYLVLRWGTCKAQQPVWMHETLVANFYAPLVVGTLAFGCCYLIRFAAVWAA